MCLSEILRVASFLLGNVPEREFLKLVEGLRNFCTYIFENISVYRETCEEYREIS